MVTGNCNGIANHIPSKVSKSMRWMTFVKSGDKFFTFVTVALARMSIRQEQTSSIFLCNNQLLIIDTIFDRIFIYRTTILPHGVTSYKLNSFGFLIEQSVFIADLPKLFSIFSFQRVRVM